MIKIKRAIKKKKENIGKIVVILVWAEEREKANMIETTSISIDMEKGKVEKEVKVEIKEEEIEAGVEVGVGAKVKVKERMLKQYQKIFQ